MEKATIYDVVRESGLSKGTVYRAVYGNGPVSEKSRRKVLEVIERLHYTPNEFATSLAVRKRRCIVCITPEFSDGSYWDCMHSGFVHTGRQVLGVGITLEYLQYSETDSKSFTDTCRKALERAPDGMVLALQFESLAQEFVLELQRRSIPYVLIDNFFEESGRLAYYGVDFFRSGRLAARLLSDGAPVDSYLLLRLKRDNEGFSDPTKRRREGFVTYFEEKYPDCRCHMLIIENNDDSARQKVLDDFFRENSGVRYAAVMNSRVHILTDYIESHPVPGIRIVGFDEIPGNLKALREDRLAFLLTHHLENQANAAVNALSTYLLRGKRPAQRDNYMHLDILTGLNMENYNAASANICSTLAGGKQFIIK